MNQSEYLQIESKLGKSLNKLFLIETFPFEKIQLLIDL